MAEGLTIAQEGFRLGLCGDQDGPWYGRRDPDVRAAWLAGRFIRIFLGGIDPRDDEYEPEMIELEQFDDEDEDAWLASIGTECAACSHFGMPCGGCQAGGMCDGVCLFCLADGAPYA